MTNQHNHSKQHHTVYNTISNGKGKFGIALLGIGILAIALVGYSYYGGSKISNNTNNSTSTSKGTCGMGGNDTNSQGGGCSATTKNVATTTPTKGGCACCGGKKKTQTTTTTTNNTIDPNSIYETINVGHDEYSLVPEAVTLTAGKSYKLIITPSADGQGCMNNMTIPGIDENIYDIKGGQPINIVINNAKAGNYNVVCGNMGMYQGKIVVQ